MNKYYLSLGSNLGNRAQYLEQARTALRQLGNMTRASAVIETKPFGAADQLFLNQLIVLQTELPPAELLDCLKTIEQRLGRQHRQHWDNREIDLDIVLWSGGKLDTMTPHGYTLTLPHPGFTDRPFLQDLYESITG
ncbi:MAG: 2-amino-4-hydroxy-6-hydroxymethyldihydropteridine diphosphokinase [Candidatus Kerfeldbacteria bacterium]|nr:2-amino-4-hydroxy-6-hydroxymethyldihydropteridine diphosphokinase [Candidatus Kerfeldbacteria bacterium]